MKWFININAIRDLKGAEIIRLGVRRLKIFLVMPVLIIVFTLFVLFSSFENAMFFPYFFTDSKLLCDVIAKRLLLWARRM